MLVRPTWENLVSNLLAVLSLNIWLYIIQIACYSSGHGLNAELLTSYDLNTWIFSGIQVKNLNAGQNVQFSGHDLYYRPFE